MKRNLETVIIAAMICIAGVSDLSAQRPGNQRGQDQSSRVAGMLKSLPIVKALDADGDGEVSAEEIENSVASLKTLDKDGDGLLKSNEIFPEMNQRRPSQGRRGGQSGDTSSLKVGELAPTFKLKSLDGKSSTDLANFKGKKPVVLFFGSYT